MFNDSAYKQVQRLEMAGVSDVDAINQEKLLMEPTFAEVRYNSDRVITELGKKK